MSTDVDNGAGAAVVGEHVQTTSRPAAARPQRLHTWMTLIPIAEYQQDRPREILFLDTFVTIEPTGDAEVPYRVLFEGATEMTVVVQIGLIFVWYGSDLATPDREFPDLFGELYPTEYRSSPPSVFEDTHVMDFVENGSDNLHFSAVHLWDHSRIYNHEISATEITLEQETRFRYGKCSTKAHIRALSKVIPELELIQDYVYHGPCLAVVGATGKGSPDMHSLVSLTPEGPNRTRVYVTIALAPDTFPEGAERVFSRLSRGRAIADVAAGVMAGYIQNEFDIDAIIWRHRRYSRSPNLLPSESHLDTVMRWGETFYPPDFDLADPTKVADVTHLADLRWRVLTRLSDLDAVEVRAFTVDRLQMAAYLDDRGQPVVLPGYCPHQGAHLGHGGTVESGCVRCPFHALHFDSDGNCIGRNPDRRSGSIDSLKLEPVGTRIIDGWVEVLV